MAWDMILAVAPAVVEHTIAPLIKHVCYPFKYKTNVRNLEEELKKLNSAGDDVQILVNEAADNGRVIGQSVKDWLSEVKDTTKRVKGILDQGTEGAKKKCFFGLCPNTIMRYKLSKKAEQEGSAVTQLLNDKERRCNAIFPRIAPMGKGLPPVQGYEDFKSRQVIFNKVMDMLRVGDVNMIGVYGGGGMGKTTLVNGIARKVMEENLFEEWVMAPVTQIPNIRKIQGEIADLLGLTLNEESERGRSHSLRKRLKQKNVLVILDDLWKEIDLEAVGIPIKDEVDKGSNKADEDSNKPNKTEQKTCKILLTSRDLDVLSNGMKCENNFPIDVLPFDEAWELFKKAAGDRFEDSSLKTTATKIAKKCQGLPVAIVTIASALRNKSPAEWKDSLRKLKSSSASTLISGLRAPIYNTIKLSYSYLESEELQSTFRLCSLMGRNASIPYLLKYSIGLGLFPDIVEVEAVQDRVHAIVLKLKASCLLLDNDTNRWLAMHDIVRDVAVSIACADHHVFALTGKAEQKDWPDQDSLRRCTGIWLHCNVVELPQELECPQLQFFHIHGKDAPLKIPDNIFTKMQQLRVLDLTNFSLSTLPLSPPSLKKLHTLCLDQCVLVDIASIGKLRTLEVLSLVKSSIKQLPEEIGELTGLKLLDLSDCSELELIPPNVISKLFKLEELYMGNSFDKWETKTSNSQGPKNASLAELKGLNQLTNLEIQIQDTPVILSDIFPRNLKRYKIFIGDAGDWGLEYETTRILKLELKESIHSVYGVSMLLKSTEDLYLHGLKDVTSTFDELDSEGFQQLKHLHVQNSPSGIQYIINTMRGNFVTAFPMLESLILDKLASLEKICHGKLRTQSFSKLKIVNVKECVKLKNIFSIQVARCLPQLQKIEVVSCNKMEVIVAEESEERANQNEGTNEIKFSQLQSLSLQNLPQLRTFCLNEDKQISVAFFNEKDMFPNLEDLNLKGINIEKLWHGQLPNSLVSPVQNLKRLVVAKCPNLKYLFSFSMIKSLGKLKYLEVARCESLEEIIDMEGLKEKENILFSELGILELLYLPKLTRFCRGYRIEFPLLKQLRMYRCLELKTFISNFTSANNDECSATNLPNEDGKENRSTRESSSVLSCWKKTRQKISRKGKSVETPTTNTTDSKETQEVELEEKGMQAAALFDEKVAFPNLAEIYIDQISDVEKIWNTDQPAEGSFSKVVSVEISFCPKLVNIFPSVLLRRFEKLEKLRIWCCDSIEEIFDLQGPSRVKKTHPFRLRDMELWRLPKLKHIWNEDPQGILSFENLRNVSAWRCDAMENLLPFSVASNNLGQLEELDIDCCKEMKEIVGKKENDKTSKYPPHFAFPRLTTLTVNGVPKFRSFYPETHTLECPRLTKLGGYDYGNAKLIGWESSKCHESQREGQLNNQVQQPLFFLDKVNPKLEELTLDGSDNSLSIMWQHPEFFSTLKVLELHNLRNKSNMFPFDFLQRLHNLETLTVENSSLNLEALFSDSDGGGISQLTDLYIGSVDGLRYIWAQDCRLDFPNLGNLSVWGCNSLVSLAKSSVSLPSLTGLYVRDCEGLLNLMTPSTAKSLEQRQSLNLRTCHAMTEVVSNQGDGPNFEIIFEQLEYVNLHSLKSLTSFYSGNYALKFPNLLEVDVDECPNMTIFAPGPLSTPKLRRPQGSLNDAIKDQYGEMAGQEVAESSITNLAEQSTLNLTFEVEGNRNFAIPNERLHSEDLSRSSGSEKDLTSKNKTTIEPKIEKQEIKGALMENGTTKLVSTLHDSRSSNDEATVAIEMSKVVKNKLVLVSKELRSEDLHVKKDLPSKNNTITEHESKEQTAQITETKITELVTTDHDSYISDNKENFTQDRNSPISEDIITHISSKLQKDSQEMVNGSKIPVSPATAIEQTPMLISTSPMKSSSSQDLISDTASRSMSEAQSTEMLKPMTFSQETSHCMDNFS